MCVSMSMRACVHERERERERQREIGERGRERRERERGGSLLHVHQEYIQYCVYMYMYTSEL